MRKLLTAVFFGMSLASCSHPKPKPAEVIPAALIDSRRPSEKLRAFLPRRVELGLAFGIAGVVADSGELDSLVLGKRSLEPPKPLSEKDEVEIGAITELFTAALLEMAVEEKKLELGDLVEKHIPALRGKMLGARTLESLLHFETPSTETSAKIVGTDGGRSYFDRMISEGEVLTPGTQFMLLGAVIEKVYHRPFSELFQNRIAVPLRLRKSGFERGRGHRRKSNGVAIGFDEGGAAQPLSFSEAGPAGPAVGMKVAIGEMRNLLSAFLNPSSDRLGRAISRVLDKSFGTRKDLSSEFLVKSGQTFGFSSALVSNRAKKQGAFVVSNQRIALDELAAVLLGAAPVDSLVVRIEAGRKRAPETEFLRLKGHYTIDRRKMAEAVAPPAGGGTEGVPAPIGFEISEVAARWVLRFSNEIHSASHASTMSYGSAVGEAAFLFPGTEADEWFALTDHDVRFRLLLSTEEKGARKLDYLRLIDLKRTAQPTSADSFYLKHDASFETYPAYEN